MFSDQTVKQVLSKVIWEECMVTPSYVRESTLPLCVLCCTMHNVTEARYRSVTGPLQKHYRTLQNVTEALRALRSVEETLQNRCKALWNVAEHYGAVTEH